MNKPVTIPFRHSIRTLQREIRWQRENRGGPRYTTAQTSFVKGLRRAIHILRQIKLHQTQTRK